MPEPAHDALDALRARLDETRAHAERLAEDVASARSGTGPQDAGPAGGAGDDDGANGGAGAAAGAGPAAPDVQAIVALVEVLRELVPEELQEQLAEVTRQILLLLRALIDWWVDRLEAPADAPRADRTSAGGPPVEDIPVA